MRAARTVFEPTGERVVEPHGRDDDHQHHGPAPALHDGTRERAEHRSARALHDHDPTGLDDHEATAGFDDDQREPRRRRATARAELFDDGARRGHHHDDVLRRDHDVVLT
jgi:hypothetical protein